jgi:2-succinyl-6-hydroxy-2,4-cyclohexadiene-1-carboxylate synthase
VTLHVRTSGSGPSLAAFHGFTGAGDAFDHLDLPFQLVAPDLPGHGLSPPAVGWDAALFNLFDVLRDTHHFLTDAVPRYVYGYSMGARLALAYALRFPERVRAVVLESGSPGIEDDSERARRRADDEELARVLERDGIEAFLARWEAHPTLASLRDLPEPLASSLRARRMRNSPAGLASALRHLGTGAQPPLWSDLPKLDVPALLVAGERDAKFCAIARAMAARLPRARVRIVPSAGHAPHLEAPREVATIISDWLNEGDRT